MPDGRSLPSETEEHGPRFELVPFGQITLHSGRDYLIKGLLPRTGLAVAWGPPGCGKSFWAFDAAMHVALGWPYGGRRVQNRPVVYIAGEGQGGLKRRVEAFRQDRMPEDPDPVPFHLIGEPLDLIGEHAKLIGCIRSQTNRNPPGLVVLDTLNRTLNGDENKPEDMAAYVRAAGAIRDAFDACVLIVHHCGVEGTRPRGHTSLTGAADAQFQVSQASETRIVEVDKQKDGPPGERITFKLRSVALGYDDDDELITSCVVDDASTSADAAGGAPINKDKLPENMRVMLTVLEEAGASGLTIDEWNQAARDAGIRCKRQGLYENRIKLKRRRLVHESQDGKWYVTRV